MDNGKYIKILEAIESYMSDIRCWAQDIEDSVESIDRKINELYGLIEEE